MPDVRPATLADADRIARIAAAGFYDDPVMALALPRRRRPPRPAPVLFGGLVRDTLPDRGTIHLADDACAAIWRDPSFEHGRMAADRVQDDAADDAPMPFTRGRAVPD